MGIPEHLIARSSDELCGWSHDQNKSHSYHNSSYSSYGGQHLSYCVLEWAYIITITIVGVGTTIFTINIVTEVTITYEIKFYNIFSAYEKKKQHHNNIKRYTGKANFNFTVEEHGKTSPCSISAWVYPKQMCKCLLPLICFKN